MDNTKWELQFSTLSAWVEKKGYRVIVKNAVADCIVFQDKVIYINMNYTPENKFYTLLHECGHLLLENGKKVFLDEHPIYPSDILDGRIERSKAYKVCLLSEETNAWRKGWRLARRLELYVNKEKYHKSMVDSVWSYVEDITKK
ncbi:MAG: hypothetical protein CMQ41_07710 [Gammaproteobacteria bacterium]|nr:hypothetical protein [Gammaproteobacteria bacterium]|tara:strand:- start:220 stop:651 length:432 start_codon:yes stop_codon:yes gene_type:complete